MYAGDTKYFRNMQKICRKSCNFHAICHSLIPSQLPYCLMFTAKPLMLLTSNLRLGVFDFREKKKYTENFIYSSEFRGKMRPRYAFETKKPTKSASYQKPTKFLFGRKMGPKRNLSEKGYLASQRNSLTKNIIKT